MIWWLTEPIPIAATGLCGVVLAVIFGAVPTAGPDHVEPVRTALAPFGNPTLLFLMGGMFIGRAMSRHQALKTWHGREVVDEAFAFAKTLEKERGYVFAHPYQDPFVIAGQGTIGLEIFEDLPDVDSVIVPIGGGGLISGVATALKTLRPSYAVAAQW